MTSHYWQITTDYVMVPDHLRCDQPNLPESRHPLTGYADTRQELLPTARLDRAQGGRGKVFRIPRGGNQPKCPVLSNDPNGAA